MLLTTKRTFSKYFGLTGSEIIRKKLTEFNINHIFGYSGGAMLPLLDAYHNCDKPKFIGTATELGAGHMAVGYAKVLGTPGCVLSTSGPGASNIVTALYDAHTDHVPIIALSGQVSTKVLGTGAFQEAPSCALMEPCTKWSYQVRNINHLPSVLELAYKCSMYGKRGPVFIDIPKDIGMDKLTKEIDVLTNMFFENYDCDHDSEMQKLAKLINNARKPIMFVGNGTKHCYQLVRQLAKKSNIPVCSSLHGLGIYDGDELLSLGMVGMHGTVYANKLIQEADLIIGIGCRFDDRCIGNESLYAPVAKEAFIKGTGGIVNFNTDRKHFKTTVNTHYNYAGDCKDYIKCLLPYVLEMRRTDWSNHVLNLKSQYPMRYHYDENRLKIEDILIALNKEIKDKDFYIANGTGNHSQQTAQYITFKNPNTLLTSGSAGSMTVDLGYIIGAYFACSNREKLPLLISVVGDGSFNMSHNELQVISKYNLPIKVLIMNNGTQAMVKVWQELFFDGRLIATDNHNPDYCKLAEAWNIPSFKCSTHDDIHTLMALLRRPRALVANCIVDSNMVFPLVSPGKSLDDMIIYEEGIYDKISKRSFDKNSVPS